jgi:diketogulonate reductase-like aldo/keto reductase
MHSIFSRIGQGLSTSIHNITKGSREFYERSDSIQYGVSLGLTLIDTAEIYGAGISEELVGHAVRNIRGEVQIASKFSPENSEYKSVIRSAENSLRRLKVDYLDLYQIHWPNSSIRIEETLSALFKLKSDGKILNIGVCNFSKKQIHNLVSIVGKGHIFSNQVEYNIYDRYIESEILPYCSEQKIKVIAYSPLDKGRVLPAGKEYEKLANIAAKYDLTIEQLALSWVVKNPNIIAIPGTTSKAHLKQNSQCLTTKLIESDLQEISSFYTEPIMVYPSEINVSESGEENRSVYKTLDQAKMNLLNLCPSPVDLSHEIIQDPIIKPVRLINSIISENSIKFELIEGRVRYWAWVIAFGYDKPIPAYVRNSK